MAGSHIYLVDWGESSYAGELRILSATSPMTPTQVGQYRRPGINHATVKESFAYLTFSLLPMGGGLEIIDVSNPVSSTLIGSYDTSYWLHNLALNESKVFVSGSSLLAGDGALFEIDVFTPTAPSLVSSYFSPEPGDVVVSEQYVYLTDWLEGFSVLLHSPTHLYLPLLVHNPEGDLGVDRDATPWSGHH